jgi:hypothetical protein
MLNDFCLDRIAPGGTMHKKPNGASRYWKTPFNGSACGHRVVAFATIQPSVRRTANWKTCRKCDKFRDAEGVSTAALRLEKVRRRTCLGKVNRRPPRTKAERRPPFPGIAFRHCISSWPMRGCYRILRLKAELVTRDIEGAIAAVRVAVG